MMIRPSSVELALPLRPFVFHLWAVAPLLIQEAGLEKTGATDTAIC